MFSRRHPSQDYKVHAGSPSLFLRENPLYDKDLRPYCGETTNRKVAGVQVTTEIVPAPRQEYKS